MDYTQYIKPELLILIPVLMIFGGFLKHAEFISDKRIPAILGAMSVAMSCLWVLGTGGLGNVPNAIFTAVIQGVLCAGAAVYGNQLYKQHIKDDEGT